ncbi:nitroreductase [Candidatus Peregrinibacteria bacterium CG10_big_fil_rev_8_21_14_0_10_49_24]|nr:MAG: nitroreductase [Candidatus Peregrinibacteria bacterium CG11_big_fil_rev_8_21_14_0_20_49_14]PIR51077.1 MAG: nitroreductase [Candidatus Peregrinibacteria bacterium CG10_big_fil_rev_8_21_14_0_10_49_24]PJA67630.1 MAG: nitroreductase [Candidatus Peregrinibacteria bacterium CG_4_9_14_3_um_filter_49_12]
MINRKSDYGINPLLLRRWSPRAMSGDEVSDEELMALFEAARWAPSSYNNQPWRFIYAKRNSEHWDRLFNLMGEFNQSWAKNASVLIVVISGKNFEHNGKPSRTHNFDTGAAWENLALEAVSRDLVAHGMEGFDYEKARNDLEIPDDYDVEAMIAIGKQGKKEDLPQELQEKEFPSDRKPLQDIIMEGTFG